MKKILGLDLGTNSIGWAIRDTGETENQIVDKGVLTFEKGVGEGKSGEFPLVKIRTESRRRRRNYQAEKYRKWNLLQTLTGEGMCPLTMEELDRWRKYSRNTPRQYPSSALFRQWLGYDLDGDGKPDYERWGFSKHENHYLFRMLAVSEEPGHRQLFRDHPLLLGRVLYQLVQRRGFRGRDDEEARTIMQGNEETHTTGAEEVAPYITRHRTLGSALYYLHKETGQRIRKRYNLRADFEQELKEICRVQEISDPLYHKFWKAIIWQRPLRSQKGLIGQCTFEEKKSRCPVSHPLYEEYRTWISINNLKIRFDGDGQNPCLLQEKVYPLFYTASTDFKLKAVDKMLKKINGRITAQTGSDSDLKKQALKLEHTKLVPAKLLYTYETLLGANWKERYGWHEALNNLPKSCPYSFEDIWHVLYTFDDKAKLMSFAQDKLKLDREAAQKFSATRLQQGYATLSLCAIRKILPFLRQGFLYSHAVYLANLPKVLGKTGLSPEEANLITRQIAKIMEEAREEKLLISTLNGLISGQLNSNTRYGMTPDYQLDQDDENDIGAKLADMYGPASWKKKSDDEKERAFLFVADGYLKFLRKPVQFSKEQLFVKALPLHDRIFAYLQETFRVPDSNKKWLWHPSEQENYLPGSPCGEIKQLGDPQPVTRGFKNPMALKTLHKLKRLINYLLRAGKIDEDTRVVIEIARELNDTNRRKAIERWQRLKEKENDEYRKRISEMATETGVNLNFDNKDVIDKYRLWVEQNHQCLYTGAVISFSELFSGSRYDFEHTIPASISFDNELKNLTVADSTYNRQVKSNRLPSELPNYNDDQLGYSAILPRIAFMEDKVLQLEAALEEWKNKTRFSSTKDQKDYCIQRRHLIRFELDYWRAKWKSFTVREYKAGWRNSQLKDTQLVTKYALPYLKTVFNRVSVEKASVVSVFREICRIQPKSGRKDRNVHSHHAEDAAVLTLIPIAAIRDSIMLKYNQQLDIRGGQAYHEPVREWKYFDPRYVTDIRGDVLINFQPQNRTLTATYKNVRKRGRQQFVRQDKGDGKWTYKLSAEGKRIPLVAKGDSIRGQLHKESNYGAIELNGRRWLVERCPISSFRKIDDCRHIVDVVVRELVTKELLRRMDAGESFENAKLAPVAFPSGKAVIKKVRCKVTAGTGYLSTGKALEIRKQDTLSKLPYKQFVYAQNEENTVCIYYEQAGNKGIDRAFRIIGLFQLAQLKIRHFLALKSDPFYQEIQIGRGKNEKSIPLSYIITIGKKVILCKEDKEELKELSRGELLRRVFRVYKFNEPAPSTIYVYLQNHLEARPNDELGNGEKDVDFDRYQARLFLNAAKFNCALEGRDFTVQIDGQIRWLF
jgi:CRISPR-associated endonuclease Csn1